MDHTQMSWKEDNVIARLHNSVDNVTLAVGQALTNPTDRSIQNAEDMIERANKSIAMALESRGNLEQYASGTVTSKCRKTPYVTLISRIF